MVYILVASIRELQPEIIVKFLDEIVAAKSDIIQLGRCLKLYLQFFVKILIDGKITFLG